MLQETATEEESKLNATKVPHSSQTTAGTENNDGNFVLNDFNSQTEEDDIFSYPDVEQSGQNQPETRLSYELAPLSSDCSLARSESDDSGEEWVQSKGAQTNAERQQVLKRKNGSKKPKGRVALPGGDSSVTSQKDRRACPVCGKVFQYLRPFMRHIKTHKTSENTNELRSHFQKDGNKCPVCDVCGKKFTNLRCLQMHSKIHTKIKDFKCRDCGKTFIQKEHLIVHTRTHSGERPYSCGLCRKQFYTLGHLKTHMKRLSGEKPYSCDICGTIFCQRGQLVQHENAHTAGRIK